MKRIIPLILSVVLTLSLCACAGTGSTGDSTPTVSKLKTAELYLSTSMAALDAAYAGAVAQYPDKAAEIETKIKPTLDQLRGAIAAYKAAVSAADETASNQAWEVARTLLTTAVSVAGPVAIRALVGV